MHNPKKYFSKTLFVGMVAATASTPLVALAKPTASEVKSVATPIRVASGSRLSSSRKAAIFVNGRAVNFGGASLLQSKGQIYVPLQPLTKAAKLTVRYYPDSRTITLQRGENLVHIGQTSSLAKAVVPIRFAIEKLKGKLQVVDNSPENRGITQFYATLPAPEGSGTIEIIQSKPSQQGKPTSISDAIQHNLTTLNAYRKKAGAPALQLDEKLNNFARQGSVALMKNHQAHHHFRTSNIWSSGFSGGAAENQGDPNGWPIRRDLNTTIDDIMKAMIDEGPGGGHHDNMLNPDFRRVGIGLVLSGNKLYLTNDFSK